MKSRAREQECPTVSNSSGRRLLAKTREGRMEEQREFEAQLKFEQLKEKLEHDDLGVKDYGVKGNWQGDIADGIERGEIERFVPKAAAPWGVSKERSFR